MKNHLFLVPVLLLIGCVAPSEFDDFGTTRSRSYSDKPFMPQGPLWPEGNKKGIDNVFDEIIRFKKMQENESLTYLQKQEYSFSKLIGREIFITTKIKDVIGRRIIGGDIGTDSWKPNSRDLGFLITYPIDYDFKFDPLYSLSDPEFFKHLRKGHEINIKGKLKDIDERVVGSRDEGYFGSWLVIKIESSEFFEKPGAYY